MASKAELMAAEASGAIVDIGYAQKPNRFLKGNVIGVDILQAPAPYPTVVVDLNVEELPFVDGSKDTVTMGCTLAHVANPLRVLAEINRVLKPNGKLIISSPNPVYYLEVILNVFFWWFGKRVEMKGEEHFYNFSQYNMEACALVTGFTVGKKIGITFTVPRTPIRFSQVRWPSLAYEIVYVLTKTGTPHGFGKAIVKIDGKKELKTFETNLF